MPSILAVSPTRSPTTSGVPPEPEMPSTNSPVCGGIVPPCSRTQPITALAAPLRTCRPPSAVDRSTPDIRVCAVNGTIRASRSSPWLRSRKPYVCLANTTIERPSGVSSARLDSCAASASSPSETPDSGRKPVACRFPRVIVPVLSSRSVFTSPAASTARPDTASTLRCTSRSIPAMPIAESSAPMVVGIRQTISDTSTIPVTPWASMALVSGAAAW